MDFNISKKRERGRRKRQKPHHKQNEKANDRGINIYHKYKDKKFHIHCM